MDPDLKYVEKGEKGRTCAECKHFEEVSRNSGIGKCFGHDVKAEGSCNYFESKEGQS